MLQDNDSRNSRDQESAECSLPAIPQKAEYRGDAKTHQNRDRLNMSVLPGDELVFLQIGHVVVGLVRLQFEKQPPNVRVKEAFRNAIRVIVMIDMFVVAAMFARPHQGRVFKSGRAENQGEKPDRPACLEGHVREKAMVTDGHTKSAAPQHPEKKCHLKPVETEMIKIDRDSGQS